MAGGSDLVKVVFALAQDEDGWPPVSSEGLWATPVGGNLYRLDNIPWFVRGVAADDVVRVEPDDDGVLWAVERVQGSGNCTIRIVPLLEGLRGEQEVVLDVFTALGAEGEGAGPVYDLVALSVPAGEPVHAVKARLREGEVDGSWAYEEGYVTQAWLDS
jgi:hypothetical protein